MDESQVALIAEQLKHALDLLQADNNALRAELAHYRDLTDHRVVGLERSREDHELRLRAATDGVTQFKLFSGLASGGSGVMAILALLRAFLGQ